MVTDLTKLTKAELDEYHFQQIKKVGATRDDDVRDAARAEAQRCMVEQRRRKGVGPRG
jgi:hypothetical protein